MIPSVVLELACAERPNQLSQLDSPRFRTNANFQTLVCIFFVNARTHRTPRVFLVVCCICWALFGAAATSYALVAVFTSLTGSYSARCVVRVHKVTVRVPARCTVVSRRSRKSCVLSDGMYACVREWFVFSLHKCFSVAFRILLSRVDFVAWLYWQYFIFYSQITDLCWQVDFARRSVSCDFFDERRDAHSACVDEQTNTRRDNFVFDQDVRHRLQKSTFIWSRRNNLILASLFFVVGY